ncbi:MAG: hypothetical protein P4L79_02955 [Legionella sp.]|uniref:hypothetical protein n=1 Tax=Legionella sp. TaxID=459 RepID=UPI0028521FCB|nr:hypothetical protein [Legionella sp.]
MPLFCDDVLDILEKKDLLNLDNERMLQAHPDQEGVKQALNILQWTTLLNGADTAQLNLNAVMKQPNLSILIELFEFLNVENSLTQAHFDALIHVSDPVTLHSILSELKKSFLFNPDNFTLIARHKNLKSLHAALTTSNTAHLLSSATPYAYVQDIMVHPNPEKRVELFIALQELGWLTEKNYKFIVACPRMELIFLALKVLAKADLLTIERFIAVIRHQNTKAIETALFIVDQEELLALSDFELLISHPQPDVLASAMARLHKEPLRNDGIVQMHQGAIRRHSHPMFVAQIFYILKSLNLLTHQNSLRVLRHPKADLLAHALAILMGTSFLTAEKAQATFTEIIMLQHPDTVASIFVLLQNLGLLTESNKKLIKAYIQLESLDNVLILLNKNGLLTKQSGNELLAFIFHHPELLTVIPILHAAGLLTLSNWGHLIKHQSLPLVSQALSALHKTKILKQPHFDVLMTHQHLNLIAPILKLLECTVFFHAPTAPLHFNWIMKHPHLHLLLKVLKLLQDAALLNQELTHEDIEITMRAPGVTYDTVCLLQKANLLKGKLAQNNFKTAIRFQKDNDIMQALSALQGNHTLTEILAQNYFEILSTRSDFSVLARALIRLQEASLLTQELFAVVISHVAAPIIIDILTLLNQNGLLHQSNRNALVKHKNPQAVLDALTLLQQEQLFSPEMAQENFDVLMKHQHPDLIAYALISLKQEGLLTSRTLAPYREAIAKYKKPDQAVDILQQLILIVKEEARLYLRSHPDMRALMGSDMEFLWDKISATVSTRMLSEYDGIYGPQNSEFIQLINTARFTSWNELDSPKAENEYAFFQPNDRDDLAWDCEATKYSSSLS